MTTHPMPELSATRVGVRTWRASNGRGDELLIGPDTVPGAFNPGELMRLALAVCNAMSTDHRLARELGEEFAATVSVVGMKNDAEERYEHFDVTITADLSAVPAEQLAQLRELSGRSVHRNCTVGRTLAAGASYQYHLESGDPTP